MAGPWEKYAAQPAPDVTPEGPWSKYAPAPAAAPASEEQPSVAGDVAKSAGSGLARGVTGLAGSIGDLSSNLGRFSDWAAEKITGQAVPEMKNPVAEAIGSDSINKAVDKVTGAPVTSYEPKTTAGKYARSAAEFVPGAVLGPGGAARNAIAYGVVPGLASEAAAQAAEGTNVPEPVARLVGGVFGLAAPALARRAITPLPISAERQAAVDTLRSEGVDLTAGQVSGSKPLRYAESILGDSPGAGGQASATMSRQREQFTEAAMRRAGADGTAAPEVMAANSDRLSNEFNRLSSQNTLRADPQLAQDIGGALREYDRVLPSEQRRIVGNLATDIVDRFSAGQGSIPGTDYQTIRSRLSRMANNARQSDPEFANAIRGLRNALDDGMTRSISPADAEAWATARQQYGNQRTLERAAVAGGEEAAAGTISPARLRIAATMRDRGAYARGEGDFAELARAGETVMSPLPNSGTAQRMNIAQIMAAGAGGASGGFLGAAAGAALPGAAGRVLYSSPVQGWLGNQLLRQEQTPAIESVARALMAARSASLPRPEAR